MRPGVIHGSSEFNPFFFRLTITWKIHLSIICQTCSSGYLAKNCVSLEMLKFISLFKTLLKTLRENEPVIELKHFPEKLLVIKNMVLSTDKLEPLSPLTYIRH